MNWLPLLSYTYVVLKDYPHHVKHYEGKGTSKIPIFKVFSGSGKIWKYSPGYLKIPIFYLFHELGKTWKYTQPKTVRPRLIRKSKIKWEKFCPNLDFTAENKMGNSHKKGWSHFKLKINEILGY